MARALDHYLGSGWQADLVTCTGDLIQDSSAEAYERFKAQAERLDLPVHCVPGNHDVRDLMQRAVGTPPFFYCDATEIDDWLIIGVDSCKAERAGGAIETSEYDRLDAAIDASDANHVMVCLHHPLSSWAANGSTRLASTIRRSFTIASRIGQGAACHFWSRAPGL